VPLFMDVHRFEGEMPSDEDIKKAHGMDLSVQEQHGVNYMKYWVSRDAKIVQCLVEAPGCGRDLRGRGAQLSRAGANR
jgi:hypothetical protein